MAKVMAGEGKKEIAVIVEVICERTIVPFPMTGLFLVITMRKVRTEAILK
jgi:hypothetical protein